MIKKRVFIAIHISEGLQNEITSWRETFFDIPLRWIKGKDLHITLIPPWYEDTIETVEEKMKAVENAMQSFPIEFHRVSYGPNPKRPRLIWAKGPTSKTIMNLYDILGNIFREQQSDRPFHPHLTLARFNQRHFSSFSVKQLNEKVYWRETVKSIVLMESILDSDSGADYTILCRIPFRGT